MDDCSTLDEDGMDVLELDNAVDGMRPAAAAGGGGGDTSAARLVGRISVGGIFSSSLSSSSQMLSLML